MVGRSKAIAANRTAAAFIFFMCALGWAAGGKKSSLNYHLELTRPLSRFEPAQIALLEKLNRADTAHLGRLKYVIVPNQWDLDPLAYSPMPLAVSWLSDQRKALVIDIGAQVFGAYEFGELVHWGPVSSGASAHETPSGHYHLNWNARIRRSSENEDWIMPWYFNFASDRGFGVHQYGLPGRPASHGCVRMLQRDAKWIFQWGEGWTVDPDSRSVVGNGTPVLVIGSYDFKKGKPWLKPAWWSTGVSLPEQEIESLR